MTKEELIKHFLAELDDAWDIARDDLMSFEQKIEVLREVERKLRQPHAKSLGA